MKNDSQFIDLVQELSDSGIKRNKIAKELGVHHSKIDRIFNRGMIEEYTPFDEEVDRAHLSQNFEWLYEEDKLEEILYKAYDGKFILKYDNDEDRIVLGRYVREKYGSLKVYFQQKGFTRVMGNVLITCSICTKVHSLKNWYEAKRDIWGLLRECPDCRTYRSAKYIKENPDKLFEHNLKRRETVEALPIIYGKEAWVAKMSEYSWRCSFSLEEGKLAMDHVIPVATGHGGTYAGNLIPLEKSVNSSKNDSNIFEWFGATRQRFELSQERFDQTIGRLASANALTVAEYREFVYWCHENKRTVDEIKADQRHSVEIWREAVGKAFPLPRYTQEPRSIYENNESEAV